MRKIRKKIIVLQDGIKECGCACMLSIIRYYGGNVSLNYLLELTNTSKKGTNFYDMSRALDIIGFDTRAYKIDDIDKLYNYNFPFISQVIINNYHHFVVIYKISNKKLLIMDPAKGLITLSKIHFASIFTGNILLLEPRKKLPIYNEENYLIIVIKNVIIGNKLIIFKLIGLTFLVILFTCLFNFHFKIIIDNVINTDINNLFIVTILFVIILVVKQCVIFLRNNLVAYLNKKIDLSIIITTVSKIISLPYSYYKNKTTGEIISRVNDLMYIKNVISRIIVVIFLDSILSLTILIILFTIDFKMTLLLFVITFIYFLIFIIFKNIIKKYTIIIQDDNARVNSLLVESISSYDTIKGLNLEDCFKNKINSAYLNSIDDNVSLIKIYNLENFLKDISEGIILLIIIYIGSRAIMNSALTIGSLITYNSLLFYFITPIRNFFEFYKDLCYVKNSIRNINNILNYKYERLDTNSNLIFCNSILIKNLEFFYNYKNKILTNVNLNIPRSSKVLILGSSGSGKSTLLKILYRYYEVDRDRIFYGKYDINDFTLRDIRSNITYVSQNELLYTDTIKNNILLERKCSDSDFLEICNLTFVNEIINSNQTSYDYMIEENGANLSGGQRQRIVLARSLLKNSSIFLIDEGLNEIDIYLERKILKNLFKKYFDKTFIVVSHRTDNNDLYDMVLNLSNGNIGDVTIRHE